jgi:hypothetical protein
MIYLIHPENLCKCHDVPPPITTIKGKKSHFFEDFVDVSLKAEHSDVHPDITVCCVQHIAQRLHPLLLSTYYTLINASQVYVSLLSQAVAHCLREIY